VLQRLHNTDARVREWALATFAKLAAVLDPPTAAAVGARAAPALQSLLQDDDRRVRERAAWLSAKMAGNAPAEGHASAE
jgi:hypothetical protein